MTNKKVHARQKSGVFIAAPGAKRLPWHLDLRTRIDDDGVQEEIVLSTAGRIAGWLTLVAMLSLAIGGWVWHANSAAHSAVVQNQTEYLEATDGD